VISIIVKEEKKPMVIFIIIRLSGRLYNLRLVSM
jgi:hypothetical protein